MSSNKPYGLSCWIVTLVSLAFISQQTSAIVINDARGPDFARTLGGYFDAVVQLQSGPFSCTGTLVTPNKVLTAKHCTSGFSASQMTVNFGDDSNNPDFSIGVSNKIEFGGVSVNLLDGNDVSVLALDGSVPQSVARPIPISTSTPTSVFALTVGYGYNGVGSIGHQFTSDGKRWAGSNLIDIYGQAGDPFGIIVNSDNIFSTDFDDGTATNNTLDQAGSAAFPTPFEASTAAGDSGGPLLVQENGKFVVVGVLSGGTTNTSQYGDISWWTGLAPFFGANAAPSLDEAWVGTDAGPGIALSSSFQRNLATVPEPSAGTSCLIAIAGFLLLRRRFQR